MAKKSKKEEKSVFPKEFYVYVCDYEDGEPIFACATKLDDCDDGPVARVKVIEEGTKHTDAHFLGKHRSE